MHENGKARRRAPERSAATQGASPRSCLGDTRSTARRRCEVASGLRDALRRSLNDDVQDLVERAACCCAASDIPADFDDGDWITVEDAGYALDISSVRLRHFVDLGELELRPHGFRLLFRFSELFRAMVDENTWGDSVVLRPLYLA